MFIWGGTSSDIRSESVTAPRDRIADDIPPPPPQKKKKKNESFENKYPHSNVLLQSRLKLERCKPHKAALDQRNVA